MLSHGVINLSNENERMQGVREIKVTLTCSTDCKGNQLTPPTSINVTSISRGSIGIIRLADNYTDRLILRTSCLIVSDPEYDRLRSLFPGMGLPASDYTLTDINTYGTLKNAEDECTVVLNMSQFLYRKIFVGKLTSDKLLSPFPGLPINTTQPIVVPLLLYSLLAGNSSVVIKEQYNNFAQGFLQMTHSFVVEVSGQQLLTQCIASGTMDDETYAYVSEEVCSELAIYTAVRVNAGYYGVVPLAAKGSGFVVMHSAVGGSRIHVFAHSDAIAMDADRLKRIADALNSEELKELAGARGRNAPLMQGVPVAAVV